MVRHLGCNRRCLELLVRHPPGCADADISELNLMAPDTPRGTPTGVAESMLDAPLPRMRQQLVADLGDRKRALPPAATPQEGTLTHTAASLLALGRQTRWRASTSAFDPKRTTREPSGPCLLTLLAW